MNLCHISQILNTSCVKMNQPLFFPKSPFDSCHFAVQASIFTSLRCSHSPSIRLSRFITHVKQNKETGSFYFYLFFFCSVNLFFCFVCLRSGTNSMQCSPLKFSCTCTNFTRTSISGKDLISFTEFYLTHLANSFIGKTIMPLLPIQSYPSIDKI